ncbi:ASKHA domain-containing protein [Faunimonas sp. B44]|uniref:ASKHA domain-containing protein n=1 Tax=Faunimonas sp. B44 TaxID=3461493 RepID=UPI004044D43C
MTAHPKDALVLFMPSGRRGRFPVGTPVLDAARSLGVYIESVCGGRGICGRCQIQVAEGQFPKHGITSSNDHLSAFSDTEARYVTKRGALQPERRLSCQALVLGDLVVDVPQDVQINRQLVRKRAETRAIERDPATRLCYVELDEPDMHKPLGDADRLLAALAGEWRLDAPRIDFRLLPKVQKVLRAGEWKVTAAVHDDGRGPQVVALWPGLHNVACGLAVDIGSTTIACHLTSILSGRVLASAGAPNPQIRFGEDLMSRVSYVMMNPDGREALTKTVREAIAVLIAKVAAEADIEADDIVEAVFVGNPIMHHLFLGIDPTELGGAPFALAISGALDFPATELGLPVNPGARIYTLPCIAGHVGADAAAATLAEGPQKSDEITLLVDVGTNAEIVLGNRDRLLAASSPTGPAFEGAEISSGQRAAPGAIERVRIDPATLEPKVKVIGDDTWSDEPDFARVVEDLGVTGICGSGIIEVIGEMYLAGIIDEDGVIDGALAARSDRIVQHGRTWSYVLWKADPARGTRELRILQTDVRAIQLAKAALYAGVRLLMDKIGIETVDRIKLAGAFGNYIDPKYAMVIGLVPDCALDKVSGVGNAAGTGARMALLNRGYRREIEALVRRIEKIETALEPRFQEHFVAAMAFPNKVHAFPNLAAAVPLPARKSDGGDGTEGGRRRRGRIRRTVE